MGHQETSDDITGCYGLCEAREPCCLLGSRSPRHRGMHAWHAQSSVLTIVLFTKRRAARRAEQSAAAMMRGVMITALVGMLSLSASAQEPGVQVPPAFQQEQPPAPPAGPEAQPQQVQQPQQAPMNVTPVQVARLEQNNNQTVDIKCAS